MRILSRLALIGLIAGAVSSAGIAVRAQREAAEHPAELAGLWSLWPDAKSDGDLVRFYFFHEDGIGLYRYGKIGLNTTNSFDWRVDGKDLVITFRKTGDVVRTPYDLRGRTLTLAQDPREPLQSNVRYTFVPPPLQANEAPDLFDEDGSLGKPGDIGGRLWIDAKKYATGGMGFSLYQLRDAAIDGRGVGWHHVGDFDDWSTEALTYRVSPTSMELWFTVRGDHGKTALLHDKTAGTLTLVEDPRGYWHVQRYKDAGPSFGSFLLERP